MVADVLETAELVVVGSGLGGMLAAIRAHDEGVKTVLVEKCHQYGGTSALSGGGVWVPLNPELGTEDSREKALSYLKGVIGPEADERKLEAYVDGAAPMVEYARSVGMSLIRADSYPDYFSEREDAVLGRTMVAGDFDGKLLGDEFFRMRRTYPSFMAFDRYALNLNAAYSLMSRQKGWIKDAFNLVAGYWADLPWRLKTSRDSRLSMGLALVAALRKAMMDRNIPLLLNTSLIGLERDDSGVAAIHLEHNGTEYVLANRAVILAAGGFEHNQAMRDSHHTAHTKSANSLTPPSANEGDAIVAGQAIGAAIENMEHAWWTPVIRLIGRDGRERAGQVFFDRSRPGNICVNRHGKRFCNEAISYDRFGHAMMEETRKIGGGLFCWMLFDADYRKNFPASDVLPGWINPDVCMPQEYWDNLIYRADSVRELAAKIGVDPDTLTSTVNTFNQYAKNGKDPDFKRGEVDFDKFFADRRGVPNGNLGPLARGPFYAVKIELGDIGTKGGLKVDENARVLDTEGSAIEGLYAIGNTTGSVFSHTYPGAGSTLGPAMVFGYLGAKHVAEWLRSKNNKVVSPEQVDELS